MNRNANTRPRPDFGETGADGCKGQDGGLPSYVGDSTTGAAYQLTIFGTLEVMPAKVPSGSKALRRGEPGWVEVYAAACRSVDWRRRNPDAWGFFASRTTADAKAGRKPNAQAYGRYIRTKDFVDVDGNPSVFPNEFIPAFVRMLAADLRRAGDDFAAACVLAECKESVFDSEGMPWEVAC